MARRTVVWLLLGLLPLASGCAMCCAPYDCSYPYVGGAWVRHNPDSGRVGSAFDEAGGPAMAGEVLEGEPTPAEQAPTTTVPGTRSVLPRARGETYLPTE